MTKSEKRIIERTVDLYNTDSGGSFNLKQYDDTKFIITVNADKVPAVFNSVHLNAVNCDNLFIRQTNNINIKGNVVTIDLNRIIVSKAGRLSLELVCDTNGKRISTFIFDDEIEKSLGNDTPLPPDDEYAKTFEISDWVIRADDIYMIEITRNIHNLSTTAYVDTAERLDGNDYVPVTYMYARSPDGAITILTEIPYSGRIVLRR